MVETSDPTPQPKVLAGGVAGAVTVLLVYVVGLAGVDVPPEVAAAVTTVITFAAGYFTSNK